MGHGTGASKARFATRAFDALAALLHHRHARRTGRDASKGSTVRTCVRMTSPSFADAVPRIDLNAARLHIVCPLCAQKCRRYAGDYLINKPRFESARRHPLLNNVFPPPGVAPRDNPSVGYATMLIRPRVGIYAAEYSTASRRPSFALSYAVCPSRWSEGGYLTTADLIPRHIHTQPWRTHAHKGLRKHA